jgi:hypothetical protein
MIQKSRRKRRLLVASIGVAAVSYACEKKAPPPEPVGNLVAPSATSGPTTFEDPETPPPEPVGNLVAPEPDPTPSDAGQ